MNNKLKKITITVGIPTYEAGEGLMETLSSIYQQNSFHEIVKEVLVIVDGKIISKNILDKIKHPALKIIYGKTRKGQSGRINDLLNNAKSDLIVLTNDDVILDKNAFKKILVEYKKTTADLITTDVKPLKPTSIFQKIIYVGYELTNQFAIQWNHRDNYHSCNGRMICLSKRISNDIKIPKKLWNNDAFIYIFAKINNFKVSHAKEAFCYYLLPATIKEHIKQSTKFKASFRENQQYFTTSIKQFYLTPWNVIFNVTITYFIKSPLKLLSYLFISFLTRIAPTDKRITKNGFWETDKSTKNIGGKIIL